MMWRAPLEARELVAVTRDVPDSGADRACARDIPVARKVMSLATVSKLKTASQARRGAPGRCYGTNHRQPLRT